MLLLRHSPLGPLRGPLRKQAAPRGATRVVATQRMRLELPEISAHWRRRIGSGALALLLGLTCFEASRQLLPQLSPAITEVELLGNSPWISRSEVQSQLQLPADASYFNVDLDAIRLRLEKLPWVAAVEVQRVWPDRLEVRLQGQLPLARWGEQDLLNSTGELFRPAAMDSFSQLPQLNGPEGHERELMQHYRLFTRLLRPTGLQISRLELRDRGSWFIETRQGISLALGRDHLPEKMRRLVHAWPTHFKGQMQDIKRIDLRYSNGLAVAWRNGSAPVVSR